MRIPLTSMQLRVSAGAVVPAVLLLLLAGARFGTWAGVVGAALVAASLALHELAHVLMALLTRTPVHAMGVSIKGPFIHRTKASTPWREVCIAACGPAVNAVLAV